MRTHYSILIVVFWLTLDLNLAAQKPARFTAKIDLIEASKKQFGTALEWHLNNKSSLDFQFGFRRHNKLPNDVFHGDWLTEYAQRRSYTVTSTTAPLKSDEGWDYFGTGRPLPDAPPAIIALSTTYFRLAYGLSYQSKPNGMRIILLPGISFTQHRFFETKDFKVQKELLSESWHVGSNQNQEQIVEQTAYYLQTRKMREKSIWVGGATYAFAFAWQAKFGISIEARLMAGVNFGSPHDETQDFPSIINNFYGQGAFLIGWAF